jgi:hypothetical protein
MRQEEECPKACETRLTYGPAGTVFLITEGGLYGHQREYAKEA